MNTETKCPICKIVFSEALWCRMENCPCVQQRKPTEEQRNALRMDEKHERAA